MGLLTNHADQIQGHDPARDGEMVPVPVTRGLLGQRPLQPGESIPVPEWGGQMTELTITVPDQNGGFMVIPSVWMTRDGPRRLSEEDAMTAAYSYMQQSGTAFPTFQDPLGASDFAWQRSQTGGIHNGPLARPR